MLSEALQFLLDVLLQPFAAILLLRFHLQWMKVPLHNPLGEFIMRLTNFIVLRTRRYIPAAWRLDSSSLLLALFFEMIYLTISIWLASVPAHEFMLPGLLLLALVKLLKISLYLLIGVVLAQAILSWVNPYTPFSPVLNAITGRYLRPIRRVIPTMGNVDLSSLALLIICQLILIVPINMLERTAFSLL